MPSTVSRGNSDASSWHGTSQGLTAYCSSLTWMRQKRVHDLTARSAAASLGYQTALGFVVRCSRPAATLKASFACSAISLSRILLSRLCIEVLQLLLTMCVGGRSPDFCTSIARLRLRRSPAKVRSEPLDLLRLLHICILRVQFEASVVQSSLENHKEGLRGLM